MLGRGEKGGPIMISVKNELRPTSEAYPGEAERGWADQPMRACRRKSPREG